MKHDSPHDSWLTEAEKRNVELRILEVCPDLWNLRGINPVVGNAKRARCRTPAFPDWNKDMVKKAVVVVLPPEEGGSAPSDRIGGITLLGRLLRSAKAAGIEEGIVLVKRAFSEDDGCLDVDPQALGFTLIDTSDRAGIDETGRAVLMRETVTGPVLLLSLHGIPDRKLLKGLCAESVAKGSALVVAPREGEADELPGAALLHPENPDEFSETLLRAASPGEVLSLVMKGSDVRIVRTDPVKVPSVRRRKDLARAEDLLFQGLIKPVESFMSRYVERKISLAVSRRLIETPVTPNQVSVMVSLLGFAAAAAFMASSRGMHVFGAVLFLLSSILDGTDGEIARLKFLESRFGSWLDFLGDNLVHVLVFFGMGVGLYRASGNSAHLVAGVMAGVGVAGTALLIFRRIFAGKGEEEVVTFISPGNDENPPTKKQKLLARITDQVANRDFIYLVLILAVVDRIQWFLWLAAVGAPTYMIALFFLYRSAKGADEPPASTEASA